MYNDVVHTEEFNGYTVNIFADTDAQNPFDDWDCEPPLAVYSDRNIAEYAVGYGNVNSVPALSRSQIVANGKAILEMLGYASFLQIRRDQYFYSDSDIGEYINDQLVDYVDNLGNSDRLDDLCGLYAMAGMPAVVKDVRGSCQGDWAKVLAVATPEFQEACGNGAAYDWHSSLTASIQLFEDWAFGNVYGYEVLDKDGEHVASCWGFFGDYDAEYGALSEARCAVDGFVEQQRKDHLQQVKAWIKNRVPLEYRIA